MRRWTGAQGLVNPRTRVTIVKINGRSFASRGSARQIGVVNHRSLLGATTRLGVGIDGVSVKVDVRSSDAELFELGTRVSLSLSSRDVLVTERKKDA